MSTIAFIGIGRMGWHMAAHLAKAGHDVVVCDVVPGMADKWVAENGGAAIASPADAVRGREYVITSLPADRVASL
jgi:3-hydroxyisobutyrate dehydrogenase